MLADVLRDHLEGISKPSKCLVGKWLSDQDAEVQDLFAQLMRKPDLNAMALFRNLDGAVPFKSTTFKLHIRETCSCPKV